jgi:hypothetical protein
MRNLATAGLILATVLCMATQPTFAGKKKSPNLFTEGTKGQHFNEATITTGDDKKSKTRGSSSGGSVRDSHDRYSNP